MALAVNQLIEALSGTETERVLVEIGEMEDRFKNHYSSA